MKKTITVLSLFLALVSGFAFGQPVSVVNSKHNLSSSGTGSVKSTSESQVCVFCHTPHGASNLAQLWNKQPHAVVPTYTLYTSPTLPVGYPAGAQPSAKSKLCLSCHDGTVAIGSVYNLPGPGGGAGGTIPNMVNTTSGMMPLAAAGNLGGAGGTNLSDDHPVGYLYRPGIAAGQDPELKAWPFSTQPKIKLDPDLATGTVECLTCHNPHDNQFPKFLNVANSNILCTTCHNKTGYTGSAHEVASPASCAGCHKPHRAAGTPLLGGVEENTCYASGCHNTTATNLLNRIQPEMDKLRAHPTNTIVGKHTSRPFSTTTGGETPTELGFPNRHAECQDCHNPHQTQLTVEKSVRGNIRISAALKGTWGVQPTWPAVGTAMTTNAVTFTAPTVFTPVGVTPAGTASVPPITDEYQVCMKCHSNYVSLPVGARNIAQEINPNNSSYHGMVPCPAIVAPSAPLWNTGCNPNYFVNTTTMVQPWGGNTITTPAYVTGIGTTANSTEWMRRNPTSVLAATATNYANRGRVWCSDCHGSNASTSPPVAGTKAAPYGPHGSSLVGIGPGTTNSDRMLVRTIASTSSGTPLCLGCHRPGSYQSGNTGSRSDYHGSRTFAEGCFSCHMWDNLGYAAGATGDIFPHGMNKRWISTLGGVVGSGQMVDSFNGGWYSNMNYATKQCWMQGPSNICGRSVQTYGPNP